MDFRSGLASIWKATPRRVRRAVFDGVLSRAHPPLDKIERAAIAGKDVPRIVVGFLSSPSGVGQAARLAARALAHEEYPVFGIDLSRYFHENAGVIDHNLEDGRGVVGRAHVIAAINAPYMHYALSLLGADFLSGKFVTGYWVWELDRVPSRWARGLSAVDDIAVPSTFVKEAVGKIAGTVPVHLAPHPVAIEHGPSSAKRPADQPFTAINVTNIASGMERKNPVALIRAFRTAFGDRRDCLLRMLISNADHYRPARKEIEAASAGARNIDVTWGAMDRSAFWSWWGTPDLYVSLHRAEGFGLPLAEAMNAGVATLATGWSGNMEFMNEHNSFLVNYRLIPIDDPQHKYDASEGFWAEPDVGDASAKLRMLDSNRELLETAAAKGRESVESGLTALLFCSGITD